jgi:hypothetical protein
MDATIAGLLGTIVGGLITFGGTWLNGRKDLKVKQMDLEALRSQAELTEKAKDRDRCREKYADFLGAYRNLDGFVVTLNDLLDAQQGNWRKDIEQRLYSPEFHKAIERLNEGTAWVSLLCHQDQAIEQNSILSTAYDGLEMQLELVLSGKDPSASLAAIKDKYEEMTSSFEKLRSMLRKETLCS